MTKYEICSYDEIGYSKVFSYQSWRIAMLNYIEELEVNLIQYVECHHETDEAFVLLEGRCTLVFATVDEKKEIINLEPVELEKNKVYIVKKGAYHTHTISKDGKVLVIEEENTSDENSTRVYFDTQAKEKMIHHVKKI